MNLLAISIYFIWCLNNLLVYLESDSAKELIKKNIAEMGKIKAYAIRFVNVVLLFALHPIFSTCQLLLRCVRQIR
jgi:hypothetical protein